MTRLVERPATQLLKGGNDLGAGAAGGVYQSANGAEELGLMRWGLDHGTPEAKRGVVLQIGMTSPPGRLLHTFAAGIHEAAC